MKYNRDAGITVVCLDCHERELFPMRSLRDAREYDRFVNDCVQRYASAHGCIVPGARIRILSHLEPNIEFMPEWDRDQVSEEHIATRHEE